MKTNVGKVDRIIRIIIGILILGAGLYFKSWFGLIGLVPIITGAIGWCGLYTIFGIKTCKIEK